MSCSIQLDNYQGHFSPGNYITGRVICIFNGSESIRGVELKLKGEENNEWMGTESYYDSREKKHKTRRVRFTGHNKFLNVEQTLRGGGEMAAGRFEYPFTLQLPNNIPSSYPGRYGGVSYTIKSKVDIAFKFDYSDSRQITVFSPINFNSMRNALQLDPVAYSDDKTVCCCCCASGPITMEVHLEKEAFVPGETVSVKVVITNMSNESILNVSAELGMEITSKVTHPQHKSKSDYELLATDGDTGVGAHGERTYNFVLQIPESAVVPNFELCELFSKITKLKVTAALPDCHTDMDIEAYVTMGHIPVYEASPSAPAVPYPQTSDAPPSYPPSDATPPSYPASDVAPPYPPSNDSLSHNTMGFVVPEGARPGPSAPPPEGGASAPSKQELAEGNFATGDAGSGDTDELPPPSYNQAMFSHPTKQ